VQATHPNGKAKRYTSSSRCLLTGQFSIKLSVHWWSYFLLVREGKQAQCHNLGYRTGTSEIEQGYMCFCMLLVTKVYGVFLCLLNKQLLLMPQFKHLGEDLISNKTRRFPIFTTMEYLPNRTLSENRLDAVDRGGSPLGHQTGTLLPYPLAVLKLTSLCAINACHIKLTQNQNNKCCWICQYPNDAKYVAGTEIPICRVQLPMMHIWSIHKW
jgi:hypothetical protein